MAIRGVRLRADRHGATISHVVTLVGFVLIGIGAVLPWVGETQLKVYILGMQTGLERVWVKRLLVLAGIGLLVESVRFVTSARQSLLALVLVGIGALVAAITVVTSPLTSAWRPTAYGVYVVLLGSVLVVIGPSTTLLTTQLDDASRSR